VVDLEESGGETGMVGDDAKLRPHGNRPIVDGGCSLNLSMLWEDRTEAKPDGPPSAENTSP
jgi:hypothetical protein